MDRLVTLIDSNTTLEPSDWSVVTIWSFKANTIATVLQQLLIRTIGKNDSH